MKPIDIVMITYNRFEFTKRVLDSLFTRTKTPFNLIIVDNASHDGSQDYFNHLKIEGKIGRLILLDKNYGLQRAKNIGFEHVTSDLYVDTDNDCLLPDLDPDWLARLTAYMEQNPDYGAISLRPQVLVGVGAIFRDAKEIVQNNVAGGSWRIMRRAVVEAVGGWEDSFENRREEWNICTKLAKTGYKVGYTRDIFTYHMFGKKNWGYDDKTPHYHRPESEVYAKDVDFDPITCEPKQRNNE